MCCSRQQSQLATHKEAEQEKQRVPLMVAKQPSFLHFFHRAPSHSAVTEVEKQQIQQLFSAVDLADYTRAGQIARRNPELLFSNQLLQGLHIRHQLPNYQHATINAIQLAVYNYDKTMWEIFYDAVKHDAFYLNEFLAACSTQVIHFPIQDTLNLYNKVINKYDQNNWLELASHQAQRIPTNFLKSYCLRKTSRPDYENSVAKYVSAEGKNCNLIDNDNINLQGTLHRTAETICSQKDIPQKPPLLRGDKSFWQALYVTRQTELATFMQKHITQLKASAQFSQSNYQPNVR